MTVWSAVVSSARCLSVLLSVFGLSMVAVGSAYIHSCPVEPMIPVFVILHGLICVIRLPFFLFGCLELLKPSACRFWCFTVIVGLFELGWLLYGSIIVFKSGYTFSEGSLLYCDKHFLKYSKSAVVLMYCMFITMSITALEDFSDKNPEIWES